MDAMPVPLPKPKGGNVAKGLEEIREPKKNEKKAKKEKKEKVVETQTEAKNIQTKRASEEPKTPPKEQVESAKDKKDRERKEKKEREMAEKEAKREARRKAEEEAKRVLEGHLQNLEKEGFTDEKRNRTMLEQVNGNYAQALKALKTERENLERAAKLSAALMELESRGFGDSSKNTRLLDANEMSVEAVAAIITAERDAYRASLLKAEQELECKVPTLQIGYVTRRGAHAFNEDRHTNLDLSTKLSKEALERRGGLDACHFWGVYDGHGGWAASEYTSRHLVEHMIKELQGTCDIEEGLCKAFKATEDEIVHIEETTEEDSGTCATCVVMTGLELSFAHVGDCRAIVASGVTPQGEIAKVLKQHELTHDHRGEYEGEKERIYSVGGKMVDGRVNGGLIPSRTLGDLSHKVKCPGAVIAEPVVNSYKLTREDQYLIIASDGLWDDMSSDRVCAVVRKATKAQAAAEALAREVAKKYGSKHMDDFTCIIVRFLHK